MAVISLKQYRTLKECRRLFKGYEQRMGEMTKDQLEAELNRFAKEEASYPHHLLTLVKGEILYKYALGKLEHRQSEIEAGLARVSSRAQERLSSFG